MERKAETVDLRRHMQHKQGLENHTEGTPETKRPDWAKKWCGSRWALCTLQSDFKRTLSKKYCLLTKADMSMH